MHQYAANESLEGKMTDNEKDPNIVNLNQWKKTAEKKAEAEKKAAQKAKPRVSSATAQKLVVVVLLLAVAWFAMPAGYLDSLKSLFVGG